MNNTVTGERVLKDEYQTTSTGQNIYLMHIASYEFARKWCVGKNVLDFGCGTGYGTHHIADSAASIVGVDVDEDSIHYANQEYRHPNLKFSCVNANEQLPFRDEEFDVILSFQVIEHVDDDSGYMKEARRLLNKDGLIVVITPDRKNRLLPMQQPWNRWHIREYSHNSLSRLIKHEFHIESMLTMTANSDIAEQELARYRKNKWILLPLTVPGIPYVIRKFMLSMVHNISAVKLASKSNNSNYIKSTQPAIDNIVFNEESPMSLNLACVARNIPATIKPITSN